MNEEFPPLVKFLVGASLGIMTAAVSSVLTVLASAVYGPALYTPGGGDFTLLGLPLGAAFAVANLSFWSTITPLVLRERQLLRRIAPSATRTAKMICLFNLLSFVAVNLVLVVVLAWLDRLPHVSAL